MENPRKQTKGRQKIDTSKKRETAEDRIITFSKRRSGLYKKAGELCTLCGVELGILIFSPTGKPFSFAHPNIEVIARRFLNLNPNEGTSSGSGADSVGFRNRINELNETLAQVSVEGVAEKERTRKLAQMARVHRNKPLCDQNIAEFNDEDAKRLKEWLLELQVRTNKRIEELTNLNYDVSLSSVVAMDVDFASSSYGYGGQTFLRN